jgi:hypothetical protein
MVESETAKHEPVEEKPSARYDHNTLVVVVSLFVTAALHSSLSELRFNVRVYI